MYKLKIQPAQMIISVDRYYPDQATAWAYTICLRPVCLNIFRVKMVLGCVTLT